MSSLRRPAAIVAAAAMVIPARAAADTPPSYEDFAGTTPAPTIVAGPPASSPAGGGVHAAFRKRKAKSRDQVLIHRRDATGGYVLVCAVPCTADLPPGAQLQATVEDGEPHVFTLEANGGHADVEIGPPRRGRLALGIVLTSVGGLTVLTGALVAAVGATVDRLDELLVPGLITLGVGGVVTFGGISLIATRSTEPRVWQSEARTRPHEAGLLPRVTTLPLTFSF